MKKIYTLLLITLLGYSQINAQSTKTVTITTPKPITILGTPSYTNATENGKADGSFSIGFEGGTGNYEYIYAKDGQPYTPVSLFSMPAGNYIMYAKDIGKSCRSADFSFTIYAPEKVKVTAPKPTNITCPGGRGSITAIAEGGFPYSPTPITRTYTYTWYSCDNSGTIIGSNPISGPNSSPTITGQNAGYYKVFATDSKGATSDGFVVQLEANPQIESTVLSTKDVSCFGINDGEIQISLKGGIAPLSVLWNDGSTSANRTGLKAGSYWYTVTDANSCKFNNNVITEIKPSPPLLQVKLDTKIQPSSPSVNDGTIAVSVIGGAGNYTYSWTKNGQPFAANTNARADLGNGSYQIKVVDKNGCGATTNTIELKALTITPLTQIDIKCKNEPTGSITIEASGGTGSYFYRWFKIENGIETQISGQTTATIANLVTGTYRVGVKDSKMEIYKNFYLSEPQNVLTATHTSTNVICNGRNDGTITLDIKGGTAPYTTIFKDVNDSAKIIDPVKLTAGTYSYIVTDHNNCTYGSPVNIEITQNAAVTIASTTKTQPTINTANDGEIIVNADGGTKTYTYTIKKNGISTGTIYTTNTITGLGDGVYEIIAKDSNNCTSAPETVILKALAVAFVNKIDVTCNRANTGSIQVIASGGTPNNLNQYNYKWYYKQKATDQYTLLVETTTNKIENLYAGFYKVIVTDNVNISRELVIAELTERPAITCIFTQTNVNCFSGSDATITLNIQGGTGDYHILWNDGVTTKDRAGIPAGDYSFTIIDDNGCSYSTAPVIVKITEPLKPLTIASFEKVDASGYLLKNGHIDVSAADGTFPYTYQWYQGTGSTKIIMTGKTNRLLDGIGLGTYSVIVTDKNKCTTEASYIINQPDELLITSIIETQSIKCFANKQAILKATISGGAPIGVPDADKRYLYKWYNKLTPNVVASTTNPSETLRAGDYILEVSDGFGNSYTSNPVTVTEPKLLKINYNQKNVSCNGGNDAQITINITGGVGPYKIVWSTGKNADQNTIKDLFASTYNVTVTDANLCTDYQEITITEPQAMGIQVLKTPPSALGQDDASIKVTVVGGTPNYNFEWFDKDGNSIFIDNDKESNSINNIYVGQYFITIIDANGCKIDKRDLDKVDPLFIKLTQINIVKCYGDATASVKAITSGGLPGYYYKWYDATNSALIISENETLMNAKAGTYYVIATDSFGKSIKSETITITEPTPLDNSLSAEYTRCGDGNDWTITSAALQGTAPYSYLWSTGARTANLVDVPPGNYSLLVTDTNGCTITKTITLIAPPHLAASEVIKIPTCYAGSDATITVTPINGIAPYTYLWNTGETSNILSNASAGEYTVAVSDSKGCIINHTYTIVNPPKDVINIGEDVTLCFDQTLTINATINDDKATYSWTSDKGFKSNKAIITVSEPANYTVVVTNKLGCEATDTLKISSQNTPISAEFALSSQVFKNEKFIIVDISNPDADEIEWVIPASATVISKNKDFAEISFSQAGEYDITLNTKKGNCTAFQTKSILVTEGEYEENNPDDQTFKKFDLKIYPNPSKGAFTVDVLLDKVMPAHVKVYNLTNNLLIDSKTQEGKGNYLFNFSLTGLPSGIYFVLFESQQGSKLRKIIIQ
ncbi:T9SS type A sorting domain-containing protein [Flavobacterium lipolyticum]|uniref:T9SS type A sorting domain-containing protein n=1 Tax=Flavobacterium lipolyticum TaxID=2893754 RepID=A0ABS8M3K8_9FLAO|nr:T9SS type A sorting domain-containing protein [Flavobacterium sp. F-126]MCC9019411.1 T9SS type A sorting domain-containing protein [Flavobacterium sp. F-126]